MQVTMNQALEARNKVCEQILQAARKHHEDPARAESYIQARVDKLFEFALQYGRDTALNDIFNGDTEG